MGLKAASPDATFYIWVNCMSQNPIACENLIVVSELPESIHTGLAFFEACLEEKAIVVPGTFAKIVRSVTFRALFRYQS